MRTRRIKIIDFNGLIRIENTDFFRTIVRALFKVEKTKEQLLRENYTNDCERLQKHLAELKKNALQNDTDLDEIRKVGELLKSI